MQKIFQWILTCAAVLVLVAGASAKPAAPSGGTGVWVCPIPAGLYMVEQLHRDKQPLLRIGYRPSDGPSVQEEILGKAKSVVAMDDSLYIAFDNGMILRKAPGDLQTDLPRLPNSAVLDRLEVDAKEKRLYALAKGAKVTSMPASRPASAPAGGRPVWSVYELRAGAWQPLAPLPLETDSVRQPMLLADDDDVEFFGLGKDSKSRLRHWSYREGAWLPQSPINLGVPVRSYQALALDELPVLLVAVEGEAGDSLYLYHLLPSEKVEKFGPLKVQSKKTLTLKARYGAADDSGSLMVGFADEAGRVKVLRWTQKGEYLGSQEPFKANPLPKSEDNSFLFFLFLMGVAVMAVFTRRTAGAVLRELPPGLVLSPAWRRIVAFVLDFLPIYFVVSMILLWTVWPQQLNEMADPERFSMYLKTHQLDPAMYRIMNIILLASTLAYVGYCILMEGFGGGTLGKRLLGLEVRQVRQLDARPTWNQVLLRNAVKVLEIPYLWPILFIVLLSRGRQRIGDMLAGTVVVQCRVAGPLER